MNVPYCLCFNITLTSIPSLNPQGTYRTSRDVSWCPSAQSSVPPVHPIPQSPRDIWDIKGRPIVSLNTILCPTCPSHPSVPKGHMGHQGTSHGVPQHNPLSHLSIPSLSPQETYRTSRDVPWCPSTQFSVLCVYPIPQSPRDIWDIKGRPMLFLSTILCPMSSSLNVMVGYLCVQSLPEWA